MARYIIQHDMGISRWVSRGGQSKQYANARIIENWYLAHADSVNEIVDWICRVSPAGRTIIPKAASAALIFLAGRSDFNVARRYVAAVTTGRNIEPNSNAEHVYNYLLSCYNRAVKPTSENRIYTYAKGLRSELRGITIKHAGNVVYRSTQDSPPNFPGFGRDVALPNSSNQAKTR